MLDDRVSANGAVEEELKGLAASIATAASASWPTERRLTAVVIGPLSPSVASPYLIAQLTPLTGASTVGAGWSSQVARRAHNPEVEGSNPSPATL